MIYSTRFSKKKWFVKIWCGVWLSLWEIRVSRSSQSEKVSPCVTLQSVYQLLGLGWSWSSNIERERETEIPSQTNIWLSGECWAMFVINIQSSPASDQSCWTVASRGERVCQVWLWLVCWYLTWTVSSLVVIPRQGVHCSQPRTPQSYSSVWEKTESSSM